MNNDRSNLLDIIKGIMIIFIIIAHFNFIYPDDFRKFGFFFWIDMAVPVFMIISGFLVAIKLEKKSIASLKQAWASELIFPRMLRFLVPFFITITLEIIFLLIVDKKGVLEIIRIIVQGG